MTTITCRRCNRVNQAGSRFCNFCGDPLTQNNEVNERPKEWRTERKILTVLFCDIVGSTTLLDQHDPEQVRSIVRPFQKSCQRVINQWEGRITEYLGDGIVAQFSGKETNAEHAINAALAINRELEQSIIRLVNQGKPIQVRCTIATGLAVVGDLLGDGEIKTESAIGLPLNLASRMLKLADPGAILVDNTTHRLTYGLLQFEDLGRHKMKGIDKKEQVWRVLAAQSVRSRFMARSTVLTPMVGREDNLNELMHCWHQCKHDHAQVVVITGDAGIGKSRIVYEFFRKIADDDHFYLEHQCSPNHTDTALYPVSNRIERVAGFEHGDTVGERLDKLKWVIQNSSKNVEHELPIFAKLLSLPVTGELSLPYLEPEQIKEQIFSTMVSNAFVLSERKPLLMTIEDVHWIDPTTLELIERLVRSIANHSITFLITARTGFTPRFTDLAYVRTQVIGRLQKTDTARLINNIIISTGKEFNPVFDVVIARTEGIPLFIEELSKSLLETIYLSNPSERQTIAQEDIPVTLQDSLQARLDRLPSQSRSLAQLAAVIGREFSFDLLKDVVKLPDRKLYHALAPLLDTQLIYQIDDPSNLRFMFKHALVRDAAYANLLRSNRVEIHLEIAQILESKYTDTTTYSPELVARHFTAGEAYQKAVQYWLEAGKQASQSSANLEARHLLEKALKLLGEVLPGQERDYSELGLLIYLGPVLNITEGAAADVTRTTYDRIIELCEQLPESPLHFAGLWGKWHNSLRFRDNYGLQLTDKLKSLAEQLNDDEYKLQASHASWTTLFHLGRFTEALDEIKKGLRYYDKKKHCHHATKYGGHDPSVCLHGFGSHILWLTGNQKQSLEMVHECATWAFSLNHTGSILQAIEANLLLYQFQKNAEEVLYWTDKLSEFCLKMELPAYHAMNLIHKGWAVAYQGELNGGLEIMKEGFAIRKKISRLEDSALYADMFAEILAAIGDTGRALKYIGHGMANSSSGGYYYWFAELTRRKGEVLLQTGDKHNAKIVFEKAIQLSLDQKCVALTARGAISLAKMLIEDNQHDIALDTLRPIHRWTTEGFDTPDLDIAKKLYLELIS